MLTPAQCKTAGPGRHYEGAVPGLHLFVRKLRSGTTSRAWVMRTSDSNGRRRDIGLGRFPDVSLEAARIGALAVRRAHTDGRDVVAERQAESGTPTFGQAATIVADLKNTRRKMHDNGGWLAMVERHASGLLSMPVDQINKRDFLAVVQPLWRPADMGGKPATAKAVRVAVKNVLDWCEEQGHIEHNPAHGSFSQSLPPLRQGQRKAVTGQDAPGVYQAIVNLGGSTSEIAKLCLRLIALTAVRKSEARAAKWSEVDLDAALWTIPGERMKAGQAHRVPLSPEAVGVLREAQRHDNGAGYVFPGQQEGALCVGQCTITDLQRRVAPGTEVHGWRTTFRTWASEDTSAPHAVMELSLAHAVGSQVERAYARSDLLDKRRALMDQWADFLTGT